MAERRAAVPSPIQRRGVAADWIRLPTGRRKDGVVIGEEPTGPLRGRRWVGGRCSLGGRQWRL